ncbi:hypothetical protein [Actinoplanes couchii]|uniref:Uncharacterized protein n=1 Tax=Actinoplanes couchii TaxID=403638 RepID=A0ABQ3XU02_9ACTN|nr:hypothetical protein [Actinoplanes couchii]MDR6318999.1 hypothetical protein [Actinoplanes couchii]GID61975.1 hypothetical protein Aco03nite_103790 [Actinoplanes couchii]
MLPALDAVLALSWSPSVRRRRPVFVADDGTGGLRTPQSGGVAAWGVTGLALIGFLTPVPGELLSGETLEIARTELVRTTGLVPGRTPLIENGREEELAAAIQQRRRAWVSSRPPGRTAA